MRLTRIHTILLLTFVGVSAATTRASGPTFWTVATSADFLQGTSDGVSISAHGVLTAGPQLTNRLNTSPAQVWSVAETADGTIWAGTGGDGKLLRLRQGQPEEVAFDAEEANVFAVAVSGTRVYAATSPDGRVYVLDGAAPARPFFDPSEKYIWALAVDGAGRLWVGAGSPAVIYRVEPDGTSRPVYRPPAGHVVAIARDNEGRMLAGTESPGRLYRFGSDDRPFALLDSGLTEMRAITVATDGTIYAAALQRGDDASAALTSAGSSTSTPAAASATPASSSGAAASTGPAGRSLLYRIDSTGAWETVWETTDLIYDLTTGDDGSVLIATGPAGRLYRLERGREVVLVTGVDARQITRFAGRPRAGARAATFATANPGRVLVPGGADQSPAAYLSDVRDSKSLATWGLIRWEATGPVALFTRAGNTEVPDDSWSDWAGPHTTMQGESIKSPPARFVQWKAVFTRAAGANPAQLTSVTVAYLPQNSRPVVASITVHPPGVVFQRPFSSDDGAIAGLDETIADARRPPGEPAQPTGTPGRRMFQKGLQTLAWKADDGDGDRLTYSLQYRREGETTWHDLRSGLLDPLFVWDTTSVPDGRYVVRVLASDSPTNAVDRALTGERESDAIEIDNTPPQITVTTARQGAVTRLSVHVQDARSPIQKLEYSIASGPWQLVYPVDGLADSPDERYEIALPAGVDAARVVLRATDQLQNVAATAAGGR